MTAPMTSREELLNLADALEKADWAGVSIGNKMMLVGAIEALRAAPAQSPKQCGESCEFFDMLWKWFEDESRIGADGMRPERHEGLSADDFKTMLDEHEAALSDPSTGLPAPAPHAEVREALEPFAKIALWRDRYPDGVDALTDQRLRGYFTPAQVRAARAALTLPQSTERGGK